MAISTSESELPTFFVVRNGVMWRRSHLRMGTNICLLIVHAATGRLVGFLLWVCCCGNLVLFTGRQSLEDDDNMKNLVVKLPTFHSLYIYTQWFLSHL